MEAKLRNIIPQAPLTDSFKNEKKRIMNLAYYLYQSGNYEKALPLFTQLCIDYPQASSFWSANAACAQMAKQFDKALSAWSMAAILDPSKAVPHFHAAEILFFLGQIDEGKKALSEAKMLADDALLDKIEVMEKRW